MLALEPVIKGEDGLIMQSLTNWEFALQIYTNCSNGISQVQRLIWGRYIYSRA